MASLFSPKPFDLNLDDINFILDQVNFKPLFDVNDNPLIQWNGAGEIYDQNGILIWDGMDTLGGTVNNALEAIAEFGSSYNHLTSFQGLREVTGFNNNLLLVNTNWGAVDGAFIRKLGANYDVLQMDLSAGVPTISTEILTQSVVNELVNPFQITTFPTFGGAIPIFVNTITRTTADTNTTTTTTDNGHTLVSTNVRTVNKTTLTEFAVEDVTGETVFASFGPFQVGLGTIENFISGGELDPLYHDFTALEVTASAALGYLPTVIDPQLGVDATVELGHVIDYTPRMITQTITTAGVDLLTVGDLFPSNGVPVGLDPDHIVYNVEFLYEDPANPANNIVNPAYTQGKDPAQLNFQEGAIEGIAIVQDYGQLAAFGSTNPHTPNNDESFIGAVNPGVAPTNGFFAIFGQFFDHGLDFVEKKGLDGNGDVAKIKIALAVDDPLYGVIGPNGQPTTSITISRATTNGVDENGDVRYVNHTSPQIDQGQTYGSHEQITAMLREWVENPNYDVLATTGPNSHEFIQGVDLVDGTNLANSWNRWDGVETTQTLVTITELRTHLEATGRDDLRWEDITELRNRDENGDVITGPNAGLSGQAMLLDINPKIDAEHILLTELQTAVTKVAPGTIVTIDAFGGPGLITVTLDDGVSPVTVNLAQLVNFGNFSVIPGLSGAQDAVANEVLLQAVGEHYFTGDGRVNENVGLTTIHHVFHEEHNFQVANMQTAILARDAKLLADNPLYDQAGAHEWQTAVTVQAVTASADVTFTAGPGGHYEANAGTLVASDINGDFYVTTLAASGLDPNFVDFVRTPPTVDVNGVQSPGTPLSAEGLYTTADGSLSWDQEKIFQGAKLIVEMEYQHVAVDQFAAAVTPDIPEFVGYNAGRDASITLEFAQDAYRYGHSTLRETIDAIDPNGGLTDQIMSYALEAAFLNPELFADLGPGAIALGQTHQQMNEIDEFITPALQQGLNGLPLDLAAINIARGRDVGLATFNEMRVALGFNEYTSWADYGANMVHADSLVNFIAAYSFDGDVAHAQAIVDAANGGTAADNLALNFVKGDASAFADNVDAAAYANQFLNGQLTGANRAGDHDDAINVVDAWMGGIAEVHVNGGLLGETFNAIFVDQITALKDGDRLYYLFRLVNQNFGEEVANGQFKDIVERTTGVTHLNGNVFGYAEEYFDFQRDAAWPTAVDLYAADGDLLVRAGDVPNADVTYYGFGGDGGVPGANTIAAIPTAVDLYGVGGGLPLVSAGSVPTAGLVYYDVNGQFIGAAQNKYGQIIAIEGKGIYSDGGVTTANNGSVVAIGDIQVGEYTVVGADYVLDTRVATTADENLDGEPRSGADAHEVIVGTDFNDIIYSRGGDDTVYGEGGHDLIYGNNGGDRLYGGDGNDTIVGGDGPELSDGGAGDDVIYGNSSETAAGGLDQLIGGTGNDTIYGGVGIDKLSGGAGDDVIFGGGDTDPFTHGGDGNDYIDGGAVGDLLFGDAGDDLVVGGDDQDIVEGDAGDDILRPGKPSNAIGGGPDEVLGGDGFIDTGFDIIEFNDYDLNPLGGVIADMGTQANPKRQIDGFTDFPQWTEIEGIVGTQNDDQFIGDSTGDRDLGGDNGNINDGGNWLIGGTGSDQFKGLGGNDVIIGGSIRLDDLIGQYQATAGAVTARAAYGDYDAYVGASHRVTDGSVLSDGLLGNANIGGVSTTEFDLHFTEFLKSDMYKDYVLGNAVEAFDPLNYNNPNSGLAADDSASTDTAIYSGLRTDYTITQISFNGITAYKIEDNRTGFDPATDRFADLTIFDGIDLLIGIEEIQFSDITLNMNQFGNTPASGAAVITGFATANVQNFAPTVNPFGPLTVNTNSITDADGIPGTGINLQWQSSPDGIAWTDVAGATTNSYQALPTDLGLQLRVVASFIDNAGVPEQVISAPTDIVGEYLLDAPGNVPGDLQGDIGQDILIGRAGNDQLQGGAGNDYLNGGLGADQMQGGIGDDIYIVNDIGDTVNEGNNGGIDEVRSSIDWTLGNNVENLRLLGNASNNINGTGNALDNRIIGNNGDNILAGGLGNDTINGRNGTDTINWNTGDGRDVVVGGATADTGTDTFAATGDASAETFNVYAIAGGVNAAQRNALITQFGPFAPGTEIVMTRGTGGGEQIIAELNNIEEIFINATDVPYNASITVPGDTINVLGDFSTTSLLVNTITIQGTNGDDTIDISSLASNHRIVLRTQGGNDTIIGDLRPQDVIEFAPGSDFATAPVTRVFNADGTMTVTDGTTSVTMPGTSTFDVRDANGATQTFSPFNVITGTQNSESLSGTNGPDHILGLDGNDSLFGQQGNDSLDGGAGNDVLWGFAGDDTVKGGDGDDVINWVAPEFSSSFFGGRDVIDGGTDSSANDAGGDTLRIYDHGGTSEIYTVYAVVGAANSVNDANKIALQGEFTTTFALGTEIVIVREVGGVRSVIAEVQNIEEINFFSAGTGFIDPTILPLGTAPDTPLNNNPNANIAADTVKIVGDFNPTSLNQNTITIQGSTGNDTVDISGLDSDHRIVFKTNGGTDTIIGDLRPQDVIEVASGNASAFSASTENGVTTLSDGTNSIVVSANSAPTIRDAAGNTQAFGAASGNPAPSTPAPTPNAAPDILIGTDADDDLNGDGNDNIIFGKGGDDLVSGSGGHDIVFGGDGDDGVLGGDDEDDLFGNDGADFIDGGAGRDRLFGGDGMDVIDGGAGNDYLFGGDGDDILTGGAGNDQAWGNDGDDIFVAEAGDGNDRYNGGAGTDTLDLSAIINDVLVDLSGNIGRAVTDNGGVDRLSNIEDVIGGSGDDTFIASDAANMFEGGSGGDEFRFNSAAQADGDSIFDFGNGIGDSINLSGIDADSTVAGNQTFTLLDQAQFNGAGELRLVVSGGSTFVEGNTDANTDTVEFSIEVFNANGLDSSDFNL